MTSKKMMRRRVTANLKHRPWLVQSPIQDGRQPPLGTALPVAPSEEFTMAALKSFSEM